MKKLLIFILCIIGFSHLQSQNYFPFPTNDGIWTELATDLNYNITDKYKILIKGDSLIQGMLLHKVYKQFYEPDSVLPPLTAENFLGFIVEDSLKHIFYCSINHCTGTIIKSMIYDFSKGVNDTIIFTTDTNNTSYSYRSLKIQKIDNIMIHGQYRKRFQFFDHPEESWIEGIGSTKSFFSSILGFPAPVTTIYEVICYMESDTSFYLNPAYNTCLPAASVTSGINKNRTFNDEVKVYPNPIQDISTIDFGNINLTNCNFEIFSATGVNAMTLKNINTTQIQISNHHFQKGMYFFKISSVENKPIIGRFIVQ